MRYLALMFVLISGLASAELYRWVDEKGKVHFSDTAPNKKAEKYTPPPILTVPAGSDSFSFKKRTAPKHKYEHISITAPANDTVYTPDQTSVTVSIDLAPSLNRGASHRLAFYLNGTLHGEGQTSYTLNNLPRGSYTASASVLDKKGNKVIGSDGVTFHVQRHHR